MKIGMLGAGAVGVPLARMFAATGHDVKLANSRGPDTLRELATSLGVTAVWSAGAVEDVDAIITSVNPGSYDSIRALLAEVPDDVPVIDTGNYHPLRDGHIAAIDDGQIEALWTQEQFGRPITKAWNTVLAQTLEEQGVPAHGSARIALAVAGDDPHGVQIATALTEATGFDPLNIGGLDNSWRMQPGNPAYCTELPLEALKTAVERADARHAPHRRDLTGQIFWTFGDDLNRRTVVRVYRAATLTPDPVSRPE